MSDLVEDFLQNHGPCLSGEVADYLVQALRISPVAARKRVSRLTGNVRRLGYVTFPRRARFMYLEQQFGAPVYWEKLVGALMQTNTAYGNAIAALRQRGGAIPERLFPIVCGAPVKQQKHLSPDPHVRADRFVERWQALQEQRRELRGWQHDDARGKVEGQMQGLAKSLERDPQVESVLRNRRQELGISQQMRQSEGISRELEQSLTRGRSLGLER